MLIRTDFHETVIGRYTLLDLLAVFSAFVGSACLFMDWVIVLDTSTQETEVLSGANMLELAGYGAGEIYIPLACSLLFLACMVMIVFTGIRERIGQWQCVSVASVGAVCAVLAFSFGIWAGFYEQIDDYEFYTGFAAYMTMLCGGVAVVHGALTRRALLGGRFESRGADDFDWLL
ncbi:MAG: hypothetical protein RBQ77_02450 [Candidatus Methanomethylophilaceae archaeon]|nr:hypothetical protein [Candidatus Methanomethylophilaceae archaeon]